MKNVGKQTKKPFYKRGWFWTIIVILVLAGSCSLDNKPKDTPSSNDTVVETETKTTTDQEPTEIESSVDTEISTNPNTETSDVKDSSAKDKLKESEGLVWFGDVRNDVTGKWRLSEYASSDTQETFAVDYYKAFFESDDEIHAVINMTNKTTACVKLITEDTLEVTIYEYVDGEEHDAKKLFGGMLLKRYFVTISTGEIEEIAE